MRLDETGEIPVRAILSARAVVCLRSECGIVRWRLPRFAGEIVDCGVEGGEDGGVGG